MHQDMLPGHETMYKWEIENFYMCPQSINACLKSNVFLDTIDLSEYQLVVYPRGRSSDRKEVFKCYLKCHKKSDFPINVTLNIALDETKVQGKKENIAMDTKDIIEIPIKLYEREPRENFHILPGKLLTISCILTQLYDPQADIDDLINLSTDFVQPLQLGFFSDITLIATRGSPFFAHKTLLTTRCPGLVQTFGTKSTNFWKCSMLPEAMWQFLQYVYTGFVPQDLKPKELSQLLYIAHDLKMDDLHRNLRPIETIPEGRTTIKLDPCQACWRIENLPTRVLAGTLSTYLQLEFSLFFVTLRVLKNEGNITGSLRFKCRKLIRCRVLTVEYEILVHCHDSWTELSRGGHRFLPGRSESDLEVTGFISESHQELPDTLLLVFNFNTSLPYKIKTCVPVRSSSNVPQQQIWTRAHHRLSLDMDLLYKNTLNMNCMALSDLRVQLDCGHVIPVHKWVLAARSKCLARMIDEHPDVIRITDARPDIADAVLRYVYCGKLSDCFDMKDLVKVYTVAVRYEVSALTEKCIYLIQEKIRIEDLQLLLQVSRESADAALIEVVISYIRCHVPSDVEQDIGKDDFACEKSFSMPSLEPRIFRSNT